MTDTSLLSLVADVGGTNTRVALARGDRIDSASIRRFRNDDFDSLDAVLTRYCSDAGAHPDAACAAMAGPVVNGTARLTNRDWQIDGAALTAATGARMTAILNDLQAQGHALGHLPEGGLRLVRPAPAPAAEDPARATRLVIGVGTGFNIAPVYADPHRFVPPAEAGHALLPLRSDNDMQLARQLARDHGIAAVEDLLSGRGIEAAYSFVTGGQHRDGHEIMADIDSDTSSRAAARIFACALGRVAGDLALIHLPTGGICLSGGMSQAFGPHLMALGFEESFRDKGRFAPFMDQFAVATIEDDCAALIGCAAHLSRLAASGITSA